MWSTRIANCAIPSRPFPKRKFWRQIPKWLNWPLTLFVGLLFPAVAVVMRALGKRLHRLTVEGQQATDDLAYVVEENVLAWRIVRLHGAAARQSARFGVRADRVRRGHLQVCEAGIDRAVGVVRISRDIHLSRGARLEGVVTRLHLAGDELTHQQTVGDIPDAVRVAAGIGDLHAALVEVLHLATAIG